MIPKTIHYCWFGRNPLPTLAKKCIRSWKKHCKGYDIIEWNEDNFDLSTAPLYVRQAYEAKKWAFVTDYIRLKVVYDHGGIYLDTDVEVLKSLDDLLQYNAFFGFEGNKWIATGLGFGAETNAPILLELMEDYKNLLFVRENGSIDDTSCPIRNTEVFLRHGLRQENQTQQIDGGVICLSTEYFCPKDYWTGQICKTKNTYAIHHYEASWLKPEQKEKHKKRVQELACQRRKKKCRKLLHTPFRMLNKILGVERYAGIKQKILKR